MLLLSTAAWGGVSNTYVHPTDPTCLGNSPCYINLPFAVQNVDNGGTVTILADVGGALTDTYGKTGITIQGSPATVELDNTILLEDFVDSWTVKDLVITAAINFRDVVGSLTLQNVTANVVNIGDFTVDTNATITLQNVTTTIGGINVTGEPGSSIDGTILMEDIDALSFNVEALVNTGAPTNIDADITIRRAAVRSISVVTIKGEGITGVGNINGNILIDDSTCLVSMARFGVTLFGSLTGDINGDVTMTNNNCYWLAVLTTGSINGGLGNITMTGNQTEVLEIVANAGPMRGDLLMSNNDVIEQGAVTELPDYLLILVDVDAFEGDVIVEDNVADEARTAIRTRDGNFQKAVSVARNSMAYITVDVQGTGADYIQAPQIVDNFVPTSDRELYGIITLRNRDGGDFPGAVMSGNTTDSLRFTANGAINGPVTISGNTTREEALIAGSDMGAGVLTIQGNNFVGESRFDRVNANVNFNRIEGMFTITNDTNAEASNNWWGCDEGPDTADCATLNNQAFTFSPWLTFNAGVDCAGSTATARFNVLTASDASEPLNNKTPGSVTVTTNDGTVNQSPVAMTNGFGMVDATLNNGVTMPTFTVTLDNETRVVMGDCSTEIFSDGFESGNTTSWSSP